MIQEKETMAQFVRRIQDNIARKSNTTLNGAIVPNKKLKTEEDIKIPYINYRNYLQTKHWKNIRNKIRNKYNGKCQICCSTNNINVHNNTYERIGKEDENDLILLCQECHEIFHNKLNK